MTPGGNVYTGVVMGLESGDGMPFSLPVIDNQFPANGVHRHGTALHLEYHHIRPTLIDLAFLFHHGQLQQAIGSNVARHWSMPA